MSQHISPIGGGSWNAASPPRRQGSADLGDLQAALAHFKLQAGTGMHVFSEAYRFAVEGRVEDLPEDALADGSAGVVVIPRTKGGDTLRVRVTAEAREAAERVLEHGPFSLERYTDSVKCAWSGSATAPRPVTSTRLPRRGRARSRRWSGVRLRWIRQPVGGRPPRVARATRGPRRPGTRDLRRSRPAPPR